MTLRQLRYIDMIAKRGSLTAAAEALFVTQPSLTAALRELEQELGITLFLRSRKGLTLTPAGEEFLGYARQILDQVSLVEQRYTGEARGRRHFCVSSQHYSFAVEAFVALLNTYGGSQYEFHMRETETYRILEDVAKVRSEIGVLYRNQFNAAVLQRNFQEIKLSFTPICRVKPHVFLGTQHPLTKKRRSRWKISATIPASPMSRDSTIRFTFPRKFRALPSPTRTLWSATAQPSLTS